MKSSYTLFEIYQACYYESYDTELASTNPKYNYVAKTINQLFKNLNCDINAYKNKGGTFSFPLKEAAILIAYEKIHESKGDLVKKIRHNNKCYITDDEMLELIAKAIKVIAILEKYEDEPTNVSNNIAGRKSKKQRSISNEWVKKIDEAMKEVSSCDAYSYSDADDISELIENTTLLDAAIRGRESLIDAYEKFINVFLDREGNEKTGEKYNNLGEALGLVTKEKLLDDTMKFDFLDYYYIEDINRFHTIRMFAIECLRILLNDTDFLKKFRPDAQEIPLFDCKEEELYRILINMLNRDFMCSHCELKQWRENFDKEKFLNNTKESIKPIIYGEDCVWNPFEIRHVCYVIDDKFDQLNQHLLDRDFYDVEKVTNEEFEYLKDHIMNSITTSIRNKLPE